MWMITPTLAKPKVAKFNAVEASGTGLTGIYLLLGRLLIE
jgi:hypothetical protein